MYGVASTPFKKEQHFKRMMLITDANEILIGLQHLLIGRYRLFNIFGWRQYIVENAKNALSSSFCNWVYDSLCKRIKILNITPEIYLIINFFQNAEKYEFHIKAIHNHKSNKSYIQAWIIMGSNLRWPFVYSKFTFTWKYAP